MPAEARQGFRIPTSEGGNEGGKALAFHDNPYFKAFVYDETFKKLQERRAPEIGETVTDAELRHTLRNRGVAYNEKVKKDREPIESDLEAARLTGDDEAVHELEEKLRCPSMVYVPFLAGGSTVQKFRELYGVRCLTVNQRTEASGMVDPDDPSVLDWLDSIDAKKSNVQFGASEPRKVCLMLQTDETPFLLEKSPRKTLEADQRYQLRTHDETLAN